MASYMNGIVATFIIIVGIILSYVSDEASNLFWTFFSLSLVTLLLSYVPLFLAFLKLRKTDKTKRVYKVPGGSVMTKVFTFVPLVLLILSIILYVYLLWLICHLSLVLWYH